MLLFGRIIYSVFTLYMIAVILRWVAPYLHIELEVGRMAWLKKITEPLLEQTRKIVKPSGFFDLSPLALLFVLWFLRTLIIRLTIGL